MTDVSHLECAAWWSHKAIQSPSITFHSIKSSLASPQKRQRDLGAVRVCYEACCQTWQWLQATLNLSHQWSLRAEIVSAECAFQSLEKREAAQLWQSSPCSTSPEETQLTGEGNPRRQYGRKSCCWRLHRIHSLCSPWVLGNHNVYSPYLWEATDVFPLRWACGTRSVVFLLPWIFPQVGSLRARMKAWAD